jgi:hypothetical protein
LTLGKQLASKSSRSIIRQHPLNQNNVVKQKNGTNSSYAFRNFIFSFFMLISLLLFLSLQTKP